MDAREVLYTTRAMRRVKPDPIPEDVVARILDAAIRSPERRERAVLEVRRGRRSRPDHEACADLPDAMAQLWASFYKAQIDAATADPDDPEHAQWLKVYRSASWLQDNFAQVPLVLFGFGGAGDVYPALWSAQLAARAEGRGERVHVGAVVPQPG